MDTLMNAQLAALVTMVIPRGQLIAAHDLNGGVSCATHRLQVLTPDQQTHFLILRRYLTHPTGVAAREFRLLQQLTAFGIEAPLPLHFDQSGVIFPEPLIVMEHINGVLSLAPRDRNSYLKQYAQQLAHIHRINAKQHDFTYLPRAIAPCSELSLDKPPYALGDTATIRRLLATQPLTQPNAPTLLHGDYWVGNLLWTAGQLVGVIDWEDAKVGEPLIDLAISRVETAALFGMQAMQEFTQHYRALSSLDFRNLAYWDLCAALRMARLVGADLSNFVAFFPPYGRSDITARFVQDNYDAFVAQALAAL